MRIIEDGRSDGILDCVLHHVAVKRLLGDHKAAA